MAATDGTHPISIIRGKNGRRLREYGVTRVHDAEVTIKNTILGRSIVDARPLDPAHCALALDLRSKISKARAVLVTLEIAYIIIGTVVERYILAANSKRIVRLTDGKKEIKVGTAYTLLAPTGRQRLGAQFERTSRRKLGKRPRGELIDLTGLLLAGSNVKGR